MNDARPSTIGALDHVPALSAETETLAKNRPTWKSNYRGEEK